MFHRFGLDLRSGLISWSIGRLTNRRFLLASASRWFLRLWNFYSGRRFLFAFVLRFIAMCRWFLTEALILLLSFSEICCSLICRLSYDFSSSWSCWSVGSCIYHCWIIRSHKSRKSIVGLYSILFALYKFIHADVHSMRQHIHFYQSLRETYSGN